MNWWYNGAATADNSFTGKTYVVAVNAEALSSGTRPSVAFSSQLNPQGRSLLAPVTLLRPLGKRGRHNAT